MTGKQQSDDSELLHEQVNILVELKEANEQPKINQQRIDWLVKQAKSLEAHIEGLKKNSRYDDQGHLTDEFLSIYDRNMAQLHGLYHRIGELYAAQEVA